MQFWVDLYQGILTNVTSKKFIALMIILILYIYGMVNELTLRIVIGIYTGGNIAEHFIKGGRK